MFDMNNQSKNTELSRIFRIPDILDQDGSIAFSATPGECAALARRFDLRGVEAFSADARLVSASGGVLRLVLTVRARITQTCVVSLEPFESEIEETAERAFVPPGAASPRPEPGKEIEILVEDEDPPEPLAAEAIDIGEIAAEHFGLALDPYPRRPGVVFEGAETQGFSDPAPRESPFAVLATARRKR